MKLPEYTPSMSDRVSTREELFELLEVLGGFEQRQKSELAHPGDLLACLEAEPTASPTEILDDISASEEQFLMEMAPFHSLLGAKAESIN
jgi:hypothetical protein